MKTTKKMTGDRQGDNLSTEIERLKRVNAALSEELEKLSTLLDNLPGMAFRCLYDAELTFAYASKAVLEILGYSPEQIVNAYAFRQMVHEEDLARNIDVVEQLSRTNNCYVMTYRIRAAAGEYRWVHEQGKAIFAEDGSLAAIDGLLTDITDRKKEEIQLREENSRLRFSIKERYRLGELIGKSDAIQLVYTRIVKAAGTSMPVIIHGESGTGKELAARTIHDLSDRKNNAFIAVNCGALPENLLESEFFGHVRGAYSGAHTNRDGYLMAADNGTLFLDEIGEMSIPLQIKLLRVLDGQGFTPVGSSKWSNADFRLICATNRDLSQLVRSGSMREDFYYRINTVPILMPPLRERLEDLPLLIDHFLQLFARETSEEVQLLPKLYYTLKRHHWPGNVRELLNVIRRYVIFKEISFPPLIAGQHHRPQQGDPPSATGSEPLPPASDEMAEFEKKMILNALHDNQWHMGRTAKSLRISRRTLQRRVSKYGLK
ncbi:MAG: sigma-54 interaction domain-containing protein [Desulfopila sp.]